MTVKSTLMLATGLAVFYAQTNIANAGSDGFVQAQSKTEIQFVGSNKNSKHGKVFAEILNQAFGVMAEKNAGLRYQISWVDDRELIVNPLLSRKVFDIGFGWEKPDCKNSNAGYMCTKFFFSKPMFSQTNTVDGRNSGKTYYAIIAKSHPRARTYLYYFNTALTHLKSSGEYQQILSQHGFARQDFSQAN